MMFQFINLAILYFCFASLEASKISLTPLNYDPYFEINELLDVPYKRKVPDTPEKMIFDVTKGTFDFFSYSMRTFSGPISVLSIQSCISNTLKHILDEMKVYEGYKRLLDRVSHRLKSDPSVTVLFDPAAIDRLIRIFQSSSVFLKDDNGVDFGKGLDNFIEGMRWSLKEVSTMEPEEFDDFLDEFLNSPPSFEELAADLFNRLKNEKELIPDHVQNEFKLPSTLETINIIQSIQDYEDLDYLFSLNFDEYLIADLKREQNFERLKIIFEYSEYEIRKNHDYKISFEYRVNTLAVIHKKPAVIELEENLKKFVKISQTQEYLFLAIESLCKTAEFNFESKDIELISYLIQEMSTEDSIIRRNCFHGSVFELETFDEKVKLFMKKLVSILRNLESEEQVDKFLGPIHDLLFNESIETIQEIMKKYSEMHEKRDEIIYCLGLVLTGQFSLMKDFVLIHLMGMRAAEVHGNPWLRNLTLKSMEQLSTIGTVSETREVTEDSDSEYLIDERRKEEEESFNEYMRNFHTLDYDEEQEDDFFQRRSTQDSVNYFSDSYW